jgi:oxygen-independent coproporphyrinogen-3 oxidase
VHFPFCAVRCTYCDFATVAGRDDRIEAYLDALIREIESFQTDAAGRPTRSSSAAGRPRA